jgi:hypothetical protein
MIVYEFIIPIEIQKIIFKDLKWILILIFF